MVGGYGNDLYYESSTTNPASKSNFEEWPFEDGKWSHIVVTYRASDKLAICFVNGHELARCTVTWGPTVTSGSDTYGLTFGDAYNKYHDGSSWVSGGNYSTRTVAGQYAHFAYWSAELKGDEIWYMSNANKGPIELSEDAGLYSHSSTLEAWYKFDQTTGTTVNDDSTNSNSVTLLNTADSNWKTYAQS